MTTAKKKAAPRGIEDILAAARPREAEVGLCLAGDLAADAERITAEIRRLGDDYAPSSLADVDPRSALRAELDKVHAAMREAEVAFRFKALAREDYSNLLAAHPPVKEGGLFNAETFPPALIAASSIEPVMTLEQAEHLYSVINQHSRDLLWSAAWRANTGAINVPFSRAALLNLSS